MIVSTIEDPERHPLWPGIRRLLESAAARHGTVAWEPEHVLWVVIEGRQIIGVLSTQLNEDEQAEIVNIAGQRAADWLADADEHICMWARGCGASKVSARGRRGWGRLSASLGWAKIGRDGQAMLYEKVL